MTTMQIIIVIAVVAMVAFAGGCFFTDKYIRKQLERLFDDFDKKW